MAGRRCHKRLARKRLNIHKALDNYDVEQSLAGFHPYLSGLSLSPTAMITAGISDNTKLNYPKSLIYNPLIVTFPPPRSFNLALPSTNKPTWPSNSTSAIRLFLIDKDHYYCYLLQSTTTRKTYVGITNNLGHQS